MSTDADILLLAAGFGSRLRPITDEIPKPLVRVGGRALIDRNLEIISLGGFKKVFINLHYRGKQIKDFVGDGSRWGLEVEFIEEETILDTGGAIKNIEAQLEHEHLITINSDILVGDDFSLQSIFEAHTHSSDQPLVTMVLRRDPNPEQWGEIGVSEDGRVLSFLGTDYGSEGSLESMMFLGVQIFRREVLGMMPAQGTVFSSTRDTLVDLLKKQMMVRSYIYDGYWSDVGTPLRLEQASKSIVD